MSTAGKYNERVALLISRACWRRAAEAAISWFLSSERSTSELSVESPNNFHHARGFGSDVRRLAFPLHAALRKRGGQFHRRHLMIRPDRRTGASTPSSAQPEKRNMIAGVGMDAGESSENFLACK